jgi:hypothetical protein
MADPHLPPSDDDATSAMTVQSATSGETVAAGPSSAPIKCCCGSLECVFLKHSYSVLDSVEKDVHTAARMGQVRFVLLVAVISHYVRSESRHCLSRMERTAPIYLSTPSHRVNSPLYLPHIRDGKIS